MWGADMKPARKHIVVFEKDHERVQTTVSLLVSEFCDRAKAEGIPISKGKKSRNIPGQPEAIEYFFMGIPMSEYVGILIQRTRARAVKV